MTTFHQTLQTLFKSNLIYLTLTQHFKGFSKMNQLRFLKDIGFEKN